LAMYSSGVMRVMGLLSQGLAALCFCFPSRWAGLSGAMVVLETGIPLLWLQMGKGKQCHFTSSKDLDCAFHKALRILDVARAQHCSKHTVKVSVCSAVFFCFDSSPLPPSPMSSLPFPTVGEETCHPAGMGERCKLCEDVGPF